MRRRSDTRLAQVAQTTAPRDLGAARRRALLRGRAAVARVVRDRPGPPEALPGVSSGKLPGELPGELTAGDAAAAALAGIPDTPDLRRADEAMLAGDHAGTEAAFAARLLHLVEQYRGGRELDPRRASPAELLAARLAGGGGPADGGPAARPPER